MWGHNGQAAQGNRLIAGGQPGTLKAGGISKIKIIRKKSRSPESVGQVSSDQGGIQSNASPGTGHVTQTKISPPSGKFKIHFFKSKNRSPDLQRDTAKESLLEKDNSLLQIKQSTQIHGGNSSGGALSKILKVLK